MASNEQRCSRRRLSFEARNTEDKQQCHLCHGHHQKVNSPSQWKSDDARRYVESLNVPADGLICQTCRKDITKVLSDSMFVPTKGSKNSSWHGTSVQAVQPLPSLSIHSEVHMSDTHMHQDTGTTPADFVIPLNSATESRTTTDISNNSITAKVSITDRPSQPLLQGHLYTASCFLTDETTSYSCSEASSSEITHPIRKRAHRSSPFQSPLKLTRSPAPKQRRLRTGTEKHTLDPLPETHFHPHNICRNSLPQADKSLSDFLLNEQETAALNDLYREVNTYMLHKLTIKNKESHDTPLNLQDYFSITRTNHTEKSNVQYLQVMDAKADSKDTQNLERVIQMHPLMITAVTVSQNTAIQN